MHSLEIEVDVNESYINRVTPDQPVTAVLDAYPDWQIPAHVIAVVPTADRQKATVLVRIGFQELDPRILPDMGVKVTFLREADAASAPAAQAVTLVPQAAVKTDNGSTFVFVLRGNTVERRGVKVGGTDGDRVEVLAGLKGGDQVVIAAPPELAEGKLIEVKKP
jgi:RND family efflux transporter MFP subunit